MGDMDSYWPIVLSDWKRAGAWVTITLRSGVQVGPGKVTDTGSVSNGMAAVLHDDGFRRAHSYSSRGPEKKWNVDLAEIVAVEAEASR